MSRARRLGIALGALLLAATLALGVAPQVVARSMNRTLEPPPEPVNAEARRIHATLRAADLHSDALLWDRDLLRRGSWGHVDLPRLVEGRVAVQAFTVVTKTPRNLNIEANAGDTDNITLLALLQAWPPRTWGSLVERALYQADKLRRFAERSVEDPAADEDGGRLVLVRTREDLAEALDSNAEATPAVAGLLGLEGTHALEGDLANVDRLFDAGFRVFGLTHFFDNEVGASAHGMSRAGLSEFGSRVLAHMEELGIVVDLAHASPALIDDVLARSTRPALVSHTGVRGTCPNQRNLDDARLAAIAATGGVIGIGLWETAICGAAPADWARAVRHAADVVGADHVALGSDWDGAVTAILDASQTVYLVQALLDQGFDEAQIRGIMGENVIRTLLRALPSQSDSPRGSMP